METKLPVLPIAARALPVGSKPPAVRRCTNGSSVLVLLLLGVAALGSSCASTHLPEGYCHGELAEERILTLEDGPAGDEIYLDSLKKCAEAGHADYQWAWANAILAEVYQVAGEYRFEEEYHEIDGLRWLARSATQGYLPALEHWSESFSWGWSGGEKDPEAAKACLQVENPQSVELCLSRIKKLLKEVEKRDRANRR